MLLTALACLPGLGVRFFFCFPPPWRMFPSTSALFSLFGLDYSFRSLALLLGRCSHPLRRSFRCVILPGPWLFSSLPLASSPFLLPYSLVVHGLLCLRLRLLLHFFCCTSRMILFVPCSCSPHLGPPLLLLLASAVPSWVVALFLAALPQLLRSDVAFRVVTSFFSTFYFFSSFSRNAPDVLFRALVLFVASSPSFFVSLAHWPSSAPPDMLLSALAFFLGLGVRLLVLLHLSG